MGEWDTMKIICAPDKFKGSLTAVQAAQAMADGIARVMPTAQVQCLPVADGGEGTVAALMASLHGQWRRSRVPGPMGQEVWADWGYEPEQKLAMLEMASACGLMHVAPDQRDILKASTFGLGILLNRVLEAGAQRIILGIGGSATNDGGLGMAQALGIRFYDDADGLIRRAIGGGDLMKIARIDMAGLSERWAQVTLQVACDVSNPLCGPQGAARMYGPQKGASPDQVHLLEQGLRHVAGIWTTQLGREVMDVPGSGAAGGLGAGLMAMLQTPLVCGIDWVLQAIGFADRVRGADLCLTGEGRLDGQSLYGKVCIGVARAAAALGVPTVALVGSLGEGAEQSLAAGLAGYRLIAPGVSAQESMVHAAGYLADAAAQVVTTVRPPVRAGGSPV